MGPADEYVLHDYLDQYGRLTRRGSSYRQRCGMRLSPTCLIQRTGPGSRSKPNGAGSTATPSTRATRRGGWPGRCDATLGEAAGRGRSRERGGRVGAPGRERATRWRCSSTPSGSTTRATATEPTRSSALPPVPAIPPPSWPLRPGSTRRQDGGRRTRPGPGAETGDTVVMERLAEHLDKADRRRDATGWLRRAAEAATPLPCSGSRRGSTRTASRTTPSGGSSEQRKRMTISRTSCGCSLHASRCSGQAG